MNTNTEHPKLPPSGKPYHLLTNSEVGSFNYYREHGGKLGVNVALKHMHTEHVGVQLVVVVKSITKTIQVDKSEAINALYDLYSSVATVEYKERMIAANPSKLSELYKVPHQESISVSQQYSLNGMLEVDKGVFIPKPQGFIGKMKFLFGMY